MLPIWYQVSREQVLAYSPSLADTVAARFPGETLKQIAVRVLKAARPDLADRIRRYLLVQSKLRNKPIVEVPIEEIEFGPIRHQSLPSSLLVRLKLLMLIFQGLPGWGPEHLVNNFRRDLEPEREVQVWERIAAAYLTLTQNGRIEESYRESAYAALLQFSLISAEEVTKAALAGDEFAVAYCDADHFEEEIDEQDDDA